MGLGYTHTAAAAAVAASCKTLTDRCCLPCRTCARCVVLRRDDAAARRLTLLWVANSSMTVDLCANIAFNEHRLVFGVQGGSECWAGQAADSARVLGPSSGCTTACPGNSTQSCGGPLALSLYALKNAPWVEADSTTTTTSEPKALIAASCVGAAASSDACKALMSAAAPVVVPHLMALLAAVLAAALWY